MAGDCDNLGIREETVDDEELEDQKVPTNATTSRQIEGAGGRQHLEQAIAARLDAGDTQGALASAEQGYGAEILGYLIRLLRDTELGREAYSRYLKATTEGISGFRRTATYRVWAYRIAYREFLKMVRERKRWVRLDTEAEGQIVAPTPMTRPRWESTTEKERLARIREKLTSEEDALLVLHVNRKLRWEEIATILTTDDAPVTATQLRKRFQRIREKLRKLMDEDRSSYHADHSDNAIG